MERDDVLENVLRLCLEKIREIQTSGVFGLVIFGCVIFGHFEEVVSFHGWFFFLSFLKNSCWAFLKIKINFAWGGWKVNTDGDSVKRLGLAMKRVDPIKAG